MRLYFERGYYAEVNDALARLYGFASAAEVPGLRVRDVDDLKRVIDRLRSTDAVVGTKTLMVLGAWSPEIS